MSCRRKKFIIAILILTMSIMPAVNIPVQAIDTIKLSTKLDIKAPIDFPQADNRVYFSGDDISVRRLLREIGQIGGINIILDPQVTGSVSVAFNGVTVREALEYLRNVGELYYSSKGDNILLVTTKDGAGQRGLTKQITKIIPVKYINSKFIAALLNSTVYAADSGSSTGAAVQAGGGQKATAEYRTNSVIIVGTDNDIRLAEDIISKVDVPRETRTYKINHADPVDVAQLLTATIFNDGVSPFDAGSGGGAGAGASALPVQPTPISVDVETFQEGAGSSQIQGASSGGGGGGQQTFTIRAKSINTLQIRVSPEGPIIVPDTRAGSITIMGTVEQIALAESLIPSLDQKLPQVAIESSLIEVSESGLRELGSILGAGSGQFAGGYNNAVATSPAGGQPAVRPYQSEPITRDIPDPTRPPTGDNLLGQRTQTYYNETLYGLIGLPTVNSTKGQEGFEFAWTTMPIQRANNALLQLNSLVSSNKAKVLANPTIIAVHNSEAIISITEEVIRRTTVTRDATGFTQTQVEIGEAGIVLDMIPKVSGNGFVSLRITPSVSSVYNTVTQGENITTLLRKRQLAVQEVRVGNGQTLALGGLVSESDISLNSRVPGLGDLPIVGALFRNSSKNSSRTEIVLLVTPRILEDANPVHPPAISSLMNDIDINNTRQR